MPLSIAAQWLSVVALIAFFRLPTLPSAMILGVAVGILMQAGQGYMQLAFVLVLPVFVAYAWYDEWFMSNRGAKVLLLCVAAGVALLLSAPLWLHLLTYPSLFSKDVDKTFSFAEPVGTLFQNMLVGTFDVAKTTAINNFAYPWAYSTYIGLTACLLAVVAPFIVRSPAHKKLTHLMVLLVVLLLFIASGTPQKMLAALHIPALTRALIGLRFLVILNGPATMAVLTLAALAVHEILTGKVLPARVQRLRRQLQRSMHVDTVAVIVLVFLTANIIDVAAFAKNWVYDAPAFSEQQLRIQADVAALGNATVTTDAEWMHMPLLEKHVNITNLHMAWQIDGAKFPRAEYEIRLDVPGDMHLVTQYKDNWVLVQSDDPETRYAVVYAPDNSVIPCEVPQARGGSILVHCDTPAGGVLRVFEHALWGWTSSVDGVTSTTPRDTDWITADVPPGVQTIRFTYQPWTATVAVLLWCLGWVIVAGVWLWSVGRWIHAMRQSTSHPTEGHVG
jgi:hypothetical protein